MVTVDAVNEVARCAGALVQRHYLARDTWVKQKADGSPVTGVDLAAESIIREGLLRLDETIPYVSEERELPPYELRRAWHRYWLVDPLDGTKEFLNRTDEFTVNIALIEDGQPVLGVVVAPASGLLYYAMEGKGAWRRKGDSGPERLQSTLSDSSKPIRVVESRSHPSPSLEAFLEPYTIAARIKSGSSLKFCLLAAGQADVYPRFGNTWEWDTAAGHAILLAAGGLVTTEDGAPLGYAKNPLLNPHFIAWGGLR